MATSAHAAGHALILYDGVCGLCNGVVQFVLRHDAAGRFWFCALQDPLAVRILASHELDAANLDTFCLVNMPFSAGEQVLVRSNAAVAVLLELGGWWRLLGKILKLFPGLFEIWGIGWWRGCATGFSAGWMPVCYRAPRNGTDSSNPAELRRWIGPARC